MVQAYARDQAAWAPSGTPAAVVRARMLGDVVATVEEMRGLRTPVVPRGAGSGLSGGANAVEGSVVLSLASMDRIVDVDVADQLAVVQPGVVNGALKRAAAEAGLWYAPDPASSEFCTVGGNVATNAGGLCCTKYGSTREHVLALQVVTGTGEVLTFGHRSPRSAVGYDLTGLLVGSEGTLGVVTEVTLRLRPPPPPPATTAAFFSSAAAAGEAVALIARSGVDPSVLEMMDRTTLTAVESWKRLDLDLDAAALVLVQTDDRGSGRAEAAAVVERCCSEAGATYAVSTTDPDEGEMFLQARKLALPALERLGTAVVDDVGVPRSRLGVLIDHVAAVSRRHGVTIGCFGHAGVGVLHPTIVLSGETAAEPARAAFDDVVTAALRLGGTITGEHGVGNLKTSFLREEVDEGAARVHLAIKRAFDPDGILNPGKAIGA
ncbi:MAG TPA: FAD-linked oxidase C-terminal domain-containing protein [Actinomycetota bacterium]|nr:FAD-linked oxidase C-terminal domain-containing protein [Actinomycetota bacterium]